MEDKNKIPLTSAEMSSLWMQYNNESLVHCMTKYFYETAEDPEVKEIIQIPIGNSKKRMSMIEEIFNKVDFPIPKGFTDVDVNLKAPRLFSDIYILRYLNHMSIVSMTASAAALSLVTRPDVVEFHKTTLNDVVQFRDKNRTLMLEQGIFVKPPSIPVPDGVDFVEKQSFLRGFFGKRRTLSSMEITHLYFNIQTNDVGKKLMTAFAQTTDNKELKDYFIRGKDMATKHIAIFEEYLKKEDIPVPMDSDIAVSSSTSRVFSDKLMLHHVSEMVAAGIGNYATAMSLSLRRDIAAKYASFIPEVSLYAEDGTNLMIKYGWMEEPPLASDRDDLTK